MPGYNRDELTAELKVQTSARAERPPHEQVEAVRRAAAESGIAHEAGPDVTLLSGGRAEVLEAMRRVIDASLDAGAHAVEVKVEAQGDAPRFGN